MTTFIRTLGAALAAFLVLGAAQEWRSLAAPLLPEAPARAAMSAGDKREAAESVYRFAQLSAHFYASGGDPRFAERLAASPDVVDEMRRDAAYVRHNQRVQQPSLIRLEVVSVDAAGPRGCEVHTKEYWTTRYAFAGSGAQDALRSDVVAMRYRVAKDGAAWRVVGWDPEETR